MITFDCDACGAIFMVSDDKAGGRGKCPKCGTAFVVPAPAARTVSSISPAGSPAADLAHERATSQAAPADAVLAQEEVVNFYWPTDSNALDELVKAIESRPTTSLPSSGGHSPLPSVPRNRKTSTPKAFGASADRPEVGTVAPSYSAQDDVALAKELVKMAEAEKIKSILVLCQRPQA
jgi:predicted Zn finger-like uncharacterized protein